ncbi:MAG: cysteine hydrolase family protein [Ectobacillus sp.]
MGTSALIVMNIQQDFTGENAAFPVETVSIPVLLCNINRAIAKAHLKGMEVVYITTEYPERSWVGKWSKKGAAIEGTEGTLLDERLKLVNDVAFSKCRNSAFTNDRLAVYLQEYKIKNIILAGAFLETCIRSTALEARRKGYRVTVIEDASGGKVQKEKQEALALMKKKGVKVLPLEEIEEFFYNSEMTKMKNN